MAKFCGNCGADIESVYTFCPVCGTQLTPEQKASSEGRKRDKKRNQTDTNAGNGPKKKKRILWKVVAIVICLAIVIVGTAGVLVYFDVVDIPVVNKILEFIGITKPYSITMVDADEYFESNSSVLAEIPVQDSEETLSEADVYGILTDRGFNQYSITTSYSIGGDYHEATDISETSAEKHPMYQTFYTAENGNVWSVIVINGTVMANPVSYNMEREMEVKVIISESTAITSYDSVTNKFYEIIPNKTTLTVKCVTEIDARTLDSLTFEEIDGL